MPHALNKRAIKMRKPGDDAEITPDARLIAAAPELLEMLQKFMDFRDSDYVPNNIFNRASTIIAKATGQTTTTP